jgi:hypothetical protein
MSGTVRWTPEQLAAHLAKNQGAGTKQGPGKHHLVPAANLIAPAPRPWEYAPAIGKRKKNKTEMAFEQEFLWPRVQTGELEFYRYESLKLVLGEKKIFTPDYHGRWAATGIIQIWEVKGPWIYEDAMVKFDTARRQFPEFEFELWQRKKGEWIRVRGR